MKITAGMRLNHYEIVAPIGQGGMGRVYHARDLRLERDVAIKLLAAQFTQDETRVSRFIREAKAASALNHPNIITIHEIGESHADSLTHFIVTELVEGHTLRHLLKRHEVTPVMALDVTTQIAGALAAAHKAGIIHRDIKPENVMVRQDGIVKVLDFGLAKLVERVVTVEAEAPTRQQLDTDPGVVMGTAQYMSPEQARGLAVDGRTDLFSLGAMMYEMIAGRTPFDGPTAADVISDLLNREPISLLHFAPDLPGDFLRIVNKLIRKDRDERYQTAKDLLVDLKVLKRELDNTGVLTDSLGLLRKKYDTPESYETSMMESDGSADAITKTLSQSPSASHTVSSAEYLTEQFLRHRRAFLTGLGATALAATGGIYIWSKRASVIDSIAVLPFEFVASGAMPKEDAAPLVDTITDSIINNLSQHKSLIVKPRSAVEALKDQPQLEIARMLKARALLTGRIVQQGEALKVSVALIDARDNRHLWGDQYTRQIADLVLLEQEISQQVTNQLLPTLSDIEKKKFEAYSLTLRGRNAWSKRTESSLQEAIRLFEQAVQADGRYAPAYAGLADSYNMLVNYSAMSGAAAFPKSKEAAQKALDLDDKLAEAHAARAYVNFQWDWNWSASEEAFRRSIELKPNYAPAYQWFSSLLACIGRLDEALVTAKRAQEIEPYSLIVSSHFAWISYIARHYDETLAQSNAKLKMDAKFFAAHRYLALAFEAQGKYAEAIEEFQKALAPSRGSILLRGELAHAYARAGQRAMALQQIEELQKLAGQRYISAFHYGLIYAGLNDRERALAALNQAVEERAERLVWLRVDPRFDSFRNDTRFIDILQRIGLV